MKTNNYIVLSLFFCISFSQNTISQNQPEISYLIGTWIFNYDASFEKMDARSKAKYNSMEEPQRIRIDNAYKNRQITFGEDGTYKQVLGDGRISLGTWSIYNNGNDIIIKNPEGQTYIQKIKSLTVSELILKPKSYGNGKILINEWNFSKI